MSVPPIDPAELRLIFDQDGDRLRRVTERAREDGRPDRFDEARFIDGSLVPAAYLEDVGRMVTIICAIEDRFPYWELES